ncbi:MAG: tRNA uridine-5-carboxymethylaminomethyl(34) synthesis GTPase MnmE [Rhodothalassiaceae bacterium]
MTAGKTIFAPASGKGRAGIAIIRLSGPAAFAALDALTGAPRPAPRRAAMRPLFDPQTGELLDRALILCFPAPHSFTGEDVLELHIHGGRAVMAGLLDALARIEGLVPAGPGDFSRRAFEAGKMDLVAAEALADLIDAETAAQRRLALAQSGGALGALYEGWRQRLLALLGRVEAAIDFADEDLPDDLFDGARRETGILRREIAAHLADGARGERIRDGVSIVLTGPPNAGKSSLLNALARRDVAIVSDLPGTTRDVLEVALDLGGYAATLIDTAGIRDPADMVEAEGVRRARMRAERADLRLHLSDKGWPTVSGIPGRDIAILTKIDLMHDQEAGRRENRANEMEGYAVSALTGAGLPELLHALEEKVIALSEVGEAPVLTRLRHRRGLEDCCAALDAFLEAPEDEPALAAEDLRIAARALGKITGRVDVEDMLDVLFSEFCIGK